MNKVFKALIACFVTAAVAAACSVFVRAAGINAAEQKILDELRTSVSMQGTQKALPADYINQAENYLNTVDITDEQADEMIRRIEDTKRFLAGTGAANYNELTDAQTDEFVALSRKTVEVIDLRLSYDKSDRVVTMDDRHNKVVFTASLGKDSNMGIAVMNPDPIKTTGSELSVSGVLVIVGIGVVLALAAGVYLVSRKKRSEAAHV